MNNNKNHMSKIIHFEIPAEDPDRVGRFYKEAFDWEISKYKGSDYWLVMAGSKEEKYGINGAIYKKGMENVTMITISVENLKETMGKVKRAGGEISGEIMDIPEVGLFAYGKDVEGTPFGMLQVSQEMADV